MPFRVVVVGPLFLDIAFGPVARMPVPGEEVWTENCAFVPGGSAIQAIALSRLGLDVDLVAYVGEDPAGHLVKEGLLREQLGLDTLVEIPRQSVTAAISTGSDRAMISFGTDSAPPLKGEAPDALVADLRAIDANNATVKLWKDSGTLVIGDVGWDDTGHWHPGDLRALDVVDVFVPNEEEALRYTRKHTVSAAARGLLQLVPAVIITRGDKGMFVADADARFDLPALPANSVDPTGAGDTFSAGLTWGLLNGGSLLQAASAGALGSSIAVETLGGSSAPPVLAELQERRHALARSEDGTEYDFSLIRAD